MARLFIDLSQPDGIPRLIKAADDITVITEIRRKRGTAQVDEVQFVKDGAPFNMGGITLSFMGKEVGKYDADPVVSLSSWTAPATVNDFYTGAPSFNTDELNALLFSPDGNAANDVPTLTLMGAFSWRIGGGPPTETEEFAVRVANKVITGAEGTPGPGFPARFAAVLDTAARMALTSADVGLGATVLQRSAGVTAQFQSFVLHTGAVTAFDDANITFSRPGELGTVNAVISGTYTAAAAADEIITQLVTSTYFTASAMDSGDFTITNTEPGPAADPTGDIEITSSTPGAFAVAAGIGSGDGVYSVVDTAALGTSGAFQILST